MVRIGDTIVSLDIIGERFRCDLSVCRGNCCRYGDAGAPLTPGESKILVSLFPILKSYLRPEGIDTIEQQGTSTTDFQGELVTPLINGEECAYTIVKDGIYMCGIEKAWHDGAIGFLKPLSCHLFPVRIKQFDDFTAVNYEKWSICQGGRESGRLNDLRVYRFLKQPLIRAFGGDWYNELETVRRELPASGISDI
ncbi:MAG: DUF3109 family protein [Bacteroidetes bacterium]|nr:DUF3109 family protein [Bacteroidota bacterium]